MSTDSIPPVDYDAAMVHELMCMADKQNATITTLATTVGKLCNQLQAHIHLTELCIRVVYLRTPSHFSGEDLTDCAANVSGRGATDD